MTVRALLSLLGIGWLLSACVPLDSNGDTLEGAILAEPEPVLERAPDATDTDCDPTDGDDGIGGTGCSVD